jgi:hypothetical protein
MTTKHDILNKLVDKDGCKFEEICDYFSMSEDKLSLLLDELLRDKKIVKIKYNRSTFIIPKQIGDELAIVCRGKGYTLTVD